MEVIQENERQKIILTEKDNKKVIQRYIHDDKWEFYKTLQKIDHPNIPKIIDVEFDNDTIVTEEYIEGKNLNTLMEEHCTFSRKQIISILKQLVSAMSELHKYNIIHRDIKPDNIIINEVGHIWLIDYDIARIYRHEARKDTESMGTFGYAPIEQYGMMPTDFKTDIYAFGVTLINLLNYSGIKGSLRKIAEKCTRLDPSQRYTTSEKLKTALKLRFLRNPLTYVAALIPIVLICISIYQYNLTKDMTFVGFELYPKYIEYMEYPTFSHTVIFSTNEPWEHLLLIDDVNMTGKIKLGRKNTRVKADITLDDGVLSVNLKDRYGHEFDHDFEYNNKYVYEQLNGTEEDPEFRKNADIICRDLDYDDVPEMLIGLNEGVMGVSGHYFYNNFNYCIGWCVKYDEDRGFTLCEGDMFSKLYAFNISSINNALTVNWYDNDDVMGYQLEGNRMQPF